MKTKNPELKNKIKAAAKQIIREEGWQKLNIRKITQLVNCATGTFYGYFNNIDELILRINKDSLDELLHFCIKHAYMSKTPKEAILTIAKAYVDFSIKREQEWIILFEYLAASK